MGDLETFNLKDFSRLMPIKEYDTIIISIDICESNRIVVFLSRNIINVCKLFDFNDIKKYEIISMLHHVKIVKECIYLVGLGPNIQVFDLKRLIQRNKSQNQEFLRSCYLFQYHMD